MRVLRADFHALYHEALLKDSKRTPVVVLVSAADCDSCASFRLLRALLKADNVPFSAYAVRGYEELQRRAAELAAADPAAVRSSAPNSRPPPPAAPPLLSRPPPRAPPSRALAPPFSRRRERRLASARR